MEDVRCYFLASEPELDHGEREIGREGVCCGLVEIDYYYYRRCSPYIDYVWCADLNL
jgi:hypothetical protein